MKKEIKGVIFFVIVSLLAGFLGSQLAGSSMMNTYGYLNKPSFAPPAWVFGPIWLVLYVLMGISAALVWKFRKEKNVKKQFALFFVQLVLNLLWPLIFFGLGQYFLAFIEILVLFIVIMATILSFSRISKASAYLLFPYLFWVGFASILNFAIALI